MSIRIGSIVLAFALTALANSADADCACGSTDPANSCSGQSATQTHKGHSITWEFTCNGQACECGQFVTGDYWVVPVDASGNPAPSVQVNGISGLNGGGAAVNPSSPDEQGVLPNSYQYVASLNIASQLPKAISPGTSIIANKRRTSGCSYGSVANGICTHVSSVLTVLGAAPPGAGSTVFRPPFAGSIKPLFSVNDVVPERIPAIPSINPSNNQNSMSNIRDRWRVPAYDLRRLGTHSRAYLPQDAMQTYGGDNARDFYGDLLSVMGQETWAQKRDAVYALMQRGIDIYGIWKAGGKWPAGAGQHIGRKGPLVFLSAMLDDDALRAEVSSIHDDNWNDFDEDGHLAAGFNGVILHTQKASSYHSAFNCGEDRYWGTMFNKLKLGRRAGNQDCGDPYGYIDGGTWPGGEYQGCCTAGNLIAFSLTQVLMPEMKAAQGSDHVIQYADRYTQNTNFDQDNGFAWTKPDFCAPPDPAESSTCSPTRGGTGCTKYKVTWGPDPNNPGQCITHGGDPMSDGRFAANHGTGKTDKIPSLAVRLYKTLRPCADGCGCTGQEGVCTASSNGGGGGVTQPTVLAAPYLAPEADPPSANGGGGATTPPPVPPATPASFPDASSTGLANCSGPRQSTGPLTTTADGQILENLDVAGNIVVKHNNITIRCVKVDAGFVAGTSGIDNAELSPNKTGLLVEDSEITGYCRKGIRSYGGGIFRRLDVHGGDDGVFMHANATLEDSYIHDLGHPSSCGPGAPHYDAVQSMGGSNINILRNRLEGPYQNQTSAILVQSTSVTGALTDVTIDGNWLSGGTFTLYVEDKGGAVPTNVRVLNNVWDQGGWKFGPRQVEKGAGWQWIGNTFSDGSVFAD